MENSNKEVVFEDVRKSYRFLYLYQRRVMDLIAFMSSHWNFIFEKGEPVFCSPPPLKKINPSSGNWVWDFLTFYNFNFVYREKKIGEYKGVKLMLNIVSDTGFYDTENNNKLSISDFKETKKSKTQLHIILKTKNLNWDIYKNKQYSVNEINTDFYHKNTENQIIIGRKIDLSSLMNETDVLKELNKFEEYCKGKGLILKPNVIMTNKN